MESPKNIAIVDVRSARLKLGYLPTNLPLARLGVALFDSPQPPPPKINPFQNHPPEYNRSSVAEAQDGSCSSVSVGFEEDGMSRRFFRVPRRSCVSILCFALLIQLNACYVEKRSPEQPDLAATAIKHPLKPEQTKALLKDAAGNWFYGQGVGNTMVQVGTVAAFPPYALVVLGNAALSLGGYEPVGVSSILPGESKEQWRSLYDGVTSGPGRFTAAVAGREFITEERAKQRLQDNLKGAAATKS